MMWNRLILAAALWLPGAALAQAPLIDGLGGPLGFGVNQLGAGDDGSLPISTVQANPRFSAELAAAFPNGFNYYGGQYAELYININGSISFGGPRLQLDPSPFPRAPGGQPPNRPIIAPYLADVDTRGLRAGVNNQIHWGVDAVNRRLIVTWNEVGYFSQRTDLFNSFQAILTARDDLAPGDFDIEFRYNRCEWTAGERQLEQPPVVHARVGFDAANGIDHAEVRPFSGTPRALEMCELSNAGSPGRWTFPARGGDVFVCGNGVVEPGEQCDEADVNLRFRSGDGCAANCLLEVDRDCDGIYALANPPAGEIPQGYDNCPGEVQLNCADPLVRQNTPGNPTYNPLQFDNDRDGAGDACDDDDDNDTILDDVDNCPLNPNGPNDPGLDNFDNDQDGQVDEAGEEAQFNFDGDPKGDACDIDSDDDGVPDYFIEGDPDSGDFDSCRFTFNPDQTDTDGDELGDPCDPDADNDGVTNCGNDLICDPEDDGYDNDRDGRVDEGQNGLDDDGNGIIDDEFECPPGQPCDVLRNLFDDDGDGYIDDSDEEDRRPPAYPGPDPDGSQDNCRVVRNGDAEADIPGVGDQFDADGDGGGNACDPDDDDDGIPDDEDNCPLTYDPIRLDTDRDGIGDVCDPDDDNDGVPDCGDDGRCPASADGEDNDSDGRYDEARECLQFGDYCEPGDDGLDNDSDGRIDEPGEDFPAPDAGEDNCQLVANPGQEDSNGNGRGDVCDVDRDGDDVPDDVDSCPDAPNPDQDDADGDEIGDICDCDRDDDGINNAGRDYHDDPCQDAHDNSPDVANPDQTDTDGDGVGDASDPDDDGDEVEDGDDNCVLVADPDQADLDGDGVGDACDCDVDGDGVNNAPGEGLNNVDERGDTCPDQTDNCNFVRNPDQSDEDRDGVGDVCEGHDDGDGVDAADDNCPDVPNPGQEDSDGDGQGDACDGDLDNDGVPNDDDNCVAMPNPGQADNEGDDVGDACDDDDDDDGILDDDDNCPLTANSDRADADDDGIGDVCDDDADDDGVLDDDNCPLSSNADQADDDEDGLGNACDDDWDGDGVRNPDDNCPQTANPQQEDFDGDGLGDACDGACDGVLYDCARAGVTEGCACDFGPRPGNPVAPGAWLLLLGLLRLGLLRTRRRRPARADNHAIRPDPPPG